MTKKAKGQAQGSAAGVSLAGLRAEARAFFEQIKAEYAISDAGGLRLLELAAASYSRQLDAADVLGVEGLTVIDKYGQVRAHPASAIESAARTSLLACLKALRLGDSPEGN